LNSMASSAAFFIADLAGRNYTDFVLNNAKKG
jgi:uncharacterized protein (DUF1778 family)